MNMNSVFHVNTTIFVGRGEDQRRMHFPFLAPGVFTLDTLHLRLSSVLPVKGWRLETEWKEGVCHLTNPVETILTPAGIAMVCLWNRGTIVDDQNLLPSEI